MSSLERQSPTTITEAEVTHAIRYEFAKSFAKENDLILDCPCGSGYGAFIMSENGGKCFGIDYSTEAIEHANEYFKNENIEFKIGNIESLNSFYENKFNLIASFEGIEHIHGQEQFLDGVKDLLRDDGIFIISTPRKPHGNVFHVKELELDEFIGLLNERFKVHELYTQVYTSIDRYDTNKSYEEYKKLNYIAICKKS